MKAFAVLCALLVASVSAEPYATGEEMTERQQRFVVDLITSAIEDFSQSLRDSGLDPYRLERKTWSWELPVPSIFSSRATVQDVRSTGLSNIVINRLSFATLATRLTFDLELPRLYGSFRRASAEVSSFGEELKAEASGNVVISRIRIAGNVRVSVGIISGISIRSIDLDFTLGGIQSNMNVAIFGINISNTVNEILSERIPSAVAEYREDLNKLLELIALDIANDILADLV